MKPQLTRSLVAPREVQVGRRDGRGLQGNSTEAGEQPKTPRNRTQPTRTPSPRDPGRQTGGRHRHQAGLEWGKLSQVDRQFRRTRTRVLRSLREAGHRRVWLTASSGPAGAHTRATLRFARLPSRLPAARPSTARLSSGRVPAWTGADRVRQGRDRLRRCSREARGVGLWPRARVVAALSRRTSPVAGGQAVYANMDQVIADMSNPRCRRRAFVTGSPEDRSVEDLMPLRVVKVDTSHEPAGSDLGMNECSPARSNSSMATGGSLRREPPWPSQAWRPPTPGADTYAVLVYASRPGPRPQRRLIHP